MRRHLLTLALVGMFGAFLASDANAGCHKKKACAPCAAPVAYAPAPCPPPIAVVECAPCPPPIVVVECAPVKKKCHFKMPKMGHGCHKKAACAPAC